LLSQPSAVPATESQSKILVSAWIKRGEAISLPCQWKGSDLDTEQWVGTTKGIFAHPYSRVGLCALACPTWRPTRSVVWHSKAASPAQAADSPAGTQASDLPKLLRRLASRLIQYWSLSLDTGANNYMAFNVRFGSWLRENAIGARGSRMAFPLSHRIIADVLPTGRSNRPGAIRFYEQNQLSRFHATRAMCGRLRVGKGFLHVTALVGAAMCSAC
jgi:hypothetical protein